jgi:hypothetical protein
LRPDVVIALSSVRCVLTCGWRSGSKFLLPTSGSGGVGVLVLHVLFVYFSILMWYICKDDQDLTIYGLELFSQIAGDLEREAVRRQLLVHLAVLGCSNRSSKLL